MPTGVLHPTVDRGLLVVGNDGTVTTHDPTGNVATRFETGATAPGAVALDPTGTRLAIESTTTNQIIVADLSAETTETVPGVSAATSFGFNRDGSLLTLSLRDGTVRLDSVGGGAAVTVLSRTVLAGSAEPGWYDPAADSVWMPIGNHVVEVLLDSDVWSARACEAVGRDFTQTELDVYVPGDLPLTPVCGEHI